MFFGLYKRYFFLFFFISCVHYKIILFFNQSLLLNYYLSTLVIYPIFHFIPQKNLGLLEFNVFYPIEFIVVKCYDLLDNFHFLCSK